MSHFTVSVITEGMPTKEKIKKALAPFQENNMGDCPKEYMEFNSVTQECKNEYANVNEATKIKYPTLKEYIEEYCGYTYDAEKKDFGYWKNPNAKWDWYQVGGRWAGKLTVAYDCINCDVGEKSWGFGNEDPYAAIGRYKKVDVARIKDLIFLDCHAKYIEAKRFWELKIEGQEPRNDKDRELLKDFYRPEYYINTYKDKETYAECERTFHTYAVIDKDGHWSAKGEMGWFGCSCSEENQEVDFIKNYKKNVFDNAGDDDYITIVDCHI